MAKVSHHHLKRLVVILSRLEGWSIKSYDNTIVSWTEEDGTPNWVDDGKPENFTYRCHKRSTIALGVLKALGWDYYDCLFGIGTQLKKEDFDGLHPHDQACD